MQLPSWGLDLLVLAHCLHGEWFDPHGVGAIRGSLVCHPSRSFPQRPKVGPWGLRLDSFTLKI